MLFAIKVARGAKQVKKNSLQINEVAFKNESLVASCSAKELSLA